MHATLYTDGGARGNPGPAGIGFVLTIGKQEVQQGKYIGEMTNNQAEYRALLAGLTRALAEGVRQLVCYLDSELVVKQLAGQYRVKDANLKPLYDRVCALIGEFERVEFIHVRREKNKAADALVNEALNKQLHT